MEISKGIIGGAIKNLMYGVEGIGKSTLAAQYPKAVFIDTEGSTIHMDVARLPSPKSWRELMDDVEWAIGHPDQIGTLVIDTADWADKLCQEEVCRNGKVKSIEEFGYGKGYKMVGEEFMKLINKLDQIRDLGVNIVITAHATMRKVEQPDEMASYDHWEPKCSRQVTPILKEWADDVFFLNYKTDVVKNAEGKTKGTGGKKRVMYTTHTAAWDAKNRHNLPDQIPMEFQEIARIIPTESMRKVPGTQIPGIDAEVKTRKTKADKAVEKMATERPPEMQSNDVERDAMLRAVWDRMVESKIGLQTLISVVSEKKFYAADVMPNAYQNEFISKMLLNSWSKLLPLLLTKQNDLPF